jgi:signal transduction histidine kinase/HAMP domain-containing protein
MFNSLKGKIIIPVIITLTLIAVMVHAVISAATENLAYELSQERILGVTQSATAYLDSLMAYAQTASSAMASSPQLLEFIENGNREEMLEYLTSHVQGVNIDGFVVADADGYVLVRTHDPERYGDSALGTPCIASAMRGTVATAYTSNPAVPIAMSSAAPIFDAQGRLVGVLSANFNMSTDEFVDNFGQIFNAEVTVFYGGVVAASTVLNVDGSRTTGLRAADRVVETVVGRGETYRTIITLYEVEHHAYYIPLRNAGGEIIGMFFLGFSNEQTLSAMADLRQALATIAVVSLVVAAVMLLFILSRLLKPLESLTQSVSKINAESMYVYGVGRTDEIGLLSKTIQNMLLDISIAQEKERKRETEERAIFMLDTSPVATILYDRNINRIDCNIRAVNMFNIDDKSMFLEKFSSLAPVHQPDGRLSADVMAFHVREAMEGGYSFLPEYICIRINGEVFPIESTFVRMRYKDDFAVIEYSREVTEEKLAEKREREAIRIQQLMYDSIPIPATLWSADGRILDCNMAMVDFLKVADKEAVLSMAFDFSPEFQPCGTPSPVKVKRTVDKVLSDGIAIRQQWEHLVEGKNVPVELTVTRIELDGEHVIACYVMDLRPLKESMQRERELEMKLREQKMNERVQLIMDAAPLCVTWYNASRIMIDCNDEAARLFGINSKEDFVAAFNTKFLDFFPPIQPCGTATMDKVNSLFNEVETQGRAKFEITHLTSKGEVLPTEVVFVRVDYDDTFMFVSYLRDLREEKAAEQEIREAGEFNQALLDSSPYVIGWWDEKGNVLGGNEQQTMEFFGVDDPKKVKDNLYAFSPELQPCGTPTPEKAAMYVAEAHKNGHARFEWLHKMPDGELVPVEVIYKMYKHKGKSVMFSYTLDLRELKRLENERLEAMQESNRAKNRFLARMSHEIRTPITAVLGISEVQLRGKEMPPHLEEAFVKIYDSSKMLLNIVNDVLDFSKIESGKMLIIHNEYDVATLVSDAAQLHVLYSEHKSISFQMHVDENLPAKLVGDVLRLRQIITNLLTNAFKYTEEGTVSFSLKHEPDKDGFVALIISIKDTGMGMTAEQIEELRGEYVRLHEQEKPFVSGTGLGIPIVHSLAQIMGAQFDLNSEVGKGTHATIRIPQEVCGEGVLGREFATSLQNFESRAWLFAKDFEFEPEPMPYGSVLVVDDVDTNLYVAEAMLESFGLKIELCERGQEAIDKIKQGKTYDIIFMDHMMPDMDGIETTQTLRLMGYNYPIVALTANALKGQAEMFMQNGFSGFMSKPMDIKLLNSHLVRFVKNKR